jgi:hypothetical protein
MGNSQAFRRLNRWLNAITGIVAWFNGGAKVFQQAWAAAEEDEAVG